MCIANHTHTKWLQLLSDVFFEPWPESIKIKIYGNGGKKPSFIEYGTDSLPRDSALADFAWAGRCLYDVILSALAFLGRCAGSAARGPGGEDEALPNTFCRLRARSNCCNAGPAVHAKIKQSVALAKSPHCGKNNPLLQSIAVNTAIHCS